MISLLTPRARRPLVRRDSGRVVSRWRSSATWFSASITPIETERVQHLERPRTQRFGLGDVFQGGAVSPVALALPRLMCSVSKYRASNRSRIVARQAPPVTGEQPPARDKYPRHVPGLSEAVVSRRRGGDVTDCTSFMTIPGRVFRHERHSASIASRAPLSDRVASREITSRRVGGIHVALLDKRVFSNGKHGRQT